MCSIRAHPAYLREKARELRTKKKLSLLEIAERLSLPKTTIFYGFAAYREGWEEYPRLADEPTFTDFVCMYIGEGYNRSRNTVSLANSDPRVIRLADHWIRGYSRNKVTYWIQYHADQDLRYLAAFWGFGLGVDPELIKLQRKSNSGQLSGRSWRSKHGVLTVCANDTQLRSRVQAWMDRTQDQWLDSLLAGV